ncbi:AAA family ATPase [bacterium]|nr:AAA family ATPase [bacterium]
METDKKVNLIYGLNGTGKTTISDYLVTIHFNCYPREGLEKNPLFSQTELLRSHHKVFWRDHPFGRQQ